MPGGLRSIYRRRVTSSVLPVANVSDCQDGVADGCSGFSQNLDADGTDGNAPRIEQPVESITGYRLNKEIVYQLLFSGRSTT